MIVQFPPLAGKQTFTSLSCSVVIIHAFSLFTSLLAQLWRTEYTNTPGQAAGLKLQRGVMEEPGNTGVATGWAVNCRVIVCCRPYSVVRQKKVSEYSGVKGEMVQVTGTVLLKPAAAVVGSHCPTLETEHAPEPVVSWAHPAGMKLKASS